MREFAKILVGTLSLTIGISILCKALISGLHPWYTFIGSGLIGFSYVWVWSSVKVKEEKK